MFWAIRSEKKANQEKEFREVEHARLELATS